MKNKAILIAATFTLTVVSAQNSSPGFFGMKPGSNDQVSGSASEKEGAKNAAPRLEKCERPLGTIAVVQPQDFMMQALNKYNLPAPSNLLRLMIQQSGCFQVVERGLGLQNMMQERQMQQGGQLKSNSNVGGGQIVSADFIMTPEVQFSENNTGGAAMLGGIGALFGPIGIVAGAVASNLKFSQASTTLIVADARSGIQVAAASGSAEKTDFQIGGVLGAVGLGAYGNTPEGQVVAAAMLNNYNEIVGVIRNQKSIVAPNATPAASQNAANSVQAGVVFNSGDILSPKIPGVKLFQRALSTSKTIATLKRDDQVVYLGEEEKDFLKVQGADGQGWVDKKLVKK
jgi:curli biogenesis system outer membrane secretion channel CsgG